MLRTYKIIPAVGLCLLCAGCDDDTAPPTGPRTQSLPGISARASATAVEHNRFQIRRAGAEAGFSSFDQSGCVVTDAQVFGAEQTLKEGPGTPTTAPLAVVSVFEANFCTFQILREIFGSTGEAVVQADTKLTEARLQATITAVDFVSGGNVQVEVDVAWTGVGDLFSQSGRSRFKTPGVLMTEWLKATARDALASGTVAVDGENVATGPSNFADIFRARSGRLEILRITPEPPDTLS